MKQLSTSVSILGSSLIFPYGTHHHLTYYSLSKKVSCYFNESRDFNSLLNPHGLEQCLSQCICSAYMTINTPVQNMLLEKSSSMSFAKSIFSYIYIYIYISYNYIYLCIHTYTHIHTPSGTSGKESACQHARLKRLRFYPWVGKIPWRRAWQSTPVFLPGESSWTEEPDGLRSIGLQRVGHN